MISLDRDKIFKQLRSKFEELESQDRGNESILFGIDNTSVFKDGNVVEGGNVLRIFELPEWKRELSIYSQSGLVVKAIETFKGEITQVVLFPDLGDQQEYELRYYSLNWSPSVADLAPPKEDDPRTNSLPKALTGFDFAETVLYIYVELKPLRAEHWKPCCVCGIRRAESIKCKWNDELAFCSQACQSMAWQQKKHDDETSQGGDVDGDDISSEYVKVPVSAYESDEMRLLKQTLNEMNVD